MVASKNCVLKCQFYYFYNLKGQYKCTSNSACPNEARYLIKEKGKCIDDCKNDEKYQFLYGGECLEKCPEGTEVDINNGIENKME